MKFKKVVCLTISALFCIINIHNSKATALFGYTHFNLGKKVVEKLDKKISKSEEKAFLSGVVYADIGRFKFDRATGIDSDSDEFVNEMKKLVKNNEEKWFAYGFGIHVFQDKETKKFLKEILNHEYSSYSEYAKDCSTLDVYFAKKSGMIYNEFLNEFSFDQVIEGLNIKALREAPNTTPKNKIKNFAMRIFKKILGITFEKYLGIALRTNSNKTANKLVIYDNLIKNTYNSLGFKISLSEIHKQAGNLLGTFIINSRIINNKQSVSESLASKIEEKSDNLADLCVTKLKSYDLNS